MKKGIVAASIMVALVGGFFLVSKPAQDDTASNQKASTTAVRSFSQVQSAVDSGGQLLDVRTAEEYAAGHIDGSKNLSLQSIEAGNLPAGSKDEEIYVYCRSGNRSAQAKNILESAGYTHITDLGAMTDVQDMGGNVVKGI